MTAEGFRAALEEHGLTQLAAGDLFDVGERTVRRWATGAVDVPRSVDLVFRYWRRFGVGPSDL